MHKQFLATGALLGALAVALGAFGAHGLKKIVAEDAMQVFQTGVQYQVYHSLALMLTAVVFEKFSQRFARIAGGLFIAGIIFFSGSLYLLTALKAMGMYHTGKIGLITPVGGLCFIAGWVFLFIAVSGKKKL